MLISNQETELYLVPSPLQDIQNIVDEIKELLLARKDALLTGAMPEDISEIDWLLALSQTQLDGIRHLAN